MGSGAAYRSNPGAASRNGFSFYSQGGEIREKDKKDFKREQDGSFRAIQKKNCGGSPFLLKGEGEGDEDKGPRKPTMGEVIWA